MLALTERLSRKDRKTLLHEGLACLEPILWALQFKGNLGLEDIEVILQRFLCAEGQDWCCGLLMQVHSFRLDARN